MQTFVIKCIWLKCLPTLTFSAYLYLTVKIFMLQHTVYFTVTTTTAEAATQKKRSKS